MKRGEFELIEIIRKKFSNPTHNVLGIGDDAAVIDKNQLITSDALVDGVHFLSNKIDFADLGYKSIAVNISDIVAMGGFPIYALITMGIPADFSDDKIDAFIRGVEAVRDIYGFDLIGGDTVKSPTFFVSITMIGKTFAHPLTRGGAKPKDYIYTTGRIGDSAIGLHLELGDLKYPVDDKEYFITRHYTPEPRLKLIEYMMKHYRINSCIDISDGFLGDLRHIADESQLGFFIEVNELPISKHKIGASFSTYPDYFYHLALTSGEDYELIFTTPDDIDTMKVYGDTGEFIIPVGFMEESGFDVRMKDKKLDLNNLQSGFNHFAKLEA